MSLIKSLFGGEANAASPSLTFPGDTAATPSSPASGSPDSASAEIMAGRKQRRDKGIARGPRGEKLSDSEKALLTAFERLYEPEVWEGVVCAPADTMAALSGRKLWEISDKERKTLSVTASMTARCFAVENPKWLALIMLSITLAQIYGTRAVMHLNEMKKEQAAKKQPEARATS
mgnify:CR=1 FL=1